MNSACEALRFKSKLKRIQTCESFDPLVLYKIMDRLLFVDQKPKSCKKMNLVPEIPKLGTKEI